MHEIAAHEKGLAAGNHQRHSNVQRAMAAKGNVGRQHRDNGPKDQRVKDIQIAPDMLLKMRVVNRSSRCRSACGLMCFHNLLESDYNKYRTGKRKIQTRSTKCQNKPETSIRLVNRSGSLRHRLVPGPQRNPITIAPPITCRACRPVSVK